MKFLSSKEFVIYYTDEANIIDLEVKKDEFYRNSWPLQLACGFMWEEKEMILDMNCFERAIDMVNFIDKQISRDIVRVTHAVSCNKVAVLSESDKNTPLHMQNIALSHYEELFSEAPYLDFNDFVGAMNDLTRNRKKYEGDHTYEKRLYDIGEKMLYPLPATTQFLVHFYEEGSMPLTMNLFIRRMVAIYSQENDEYTPLDAFIEFVNFIEESHEKKGEIH